MLSFRDRSVLFILLALLLALMEISAPLHGETSADDVVLTPLTEDGRSTSLAWAYHGNRIVFVREISNTQSQLWIMNSDGSEQKAVSPIGYPFFAEWSWAGDKLSYEFANARQRESQGGVYIYDVETDRTMSISAHHTLSSIDEDEGPVWSADDKYVIYKVYARPSKTDQLWVVDTKPGKNNLLLSELGEGNSPCFSKTTPNIIALRIVSDGDGFDVATVRPDGQEFIRLTDVGAQSIRTRNPSYSPSGEWIAFGSDVDMTQNERENGRGDCWIARPDGSEAINLTNATSPATENQLVLWSYRWSWDSRWIVASGYRYDNQGNRISTRYFVDPVNGGYWPILTSDPRTTGEIQFVESMKWSYDSTKIIFVTKRFTVKNWGGEAQYENKRYALMIYDVAKNEFEDLLEFDEKLDRKSIQAEDDRDEMMNISWSPDNRSILITIATIISEAEDILQSDIYRLDLPDRLISKKAALHIGPPTGRGDLVIAASNDSITGQQAMPDTAQPAQAETVTTADDEQFVTEVINPKNMTVEEVKSTLPVKYNQYTTDNAARNIILFKGPSSLLKEFRRDLELVDTPPPHILVDMLAVELSDEANRSLGLDWTWAKGHFGLYQPGGNAIRDLSPDESLNGLITYPGVGQTFYNGVGRMSREFFVRLNTLVRNGEAMILANPRTVSLSGKESKINIRKTLNFFFNEGFDTAGRPIVKKSDISSETMGRIIPTLLPDGKIHLVVDVGVGSFLFTSEQGLPEQTTRQSTTEVTVQAGQTIVIGGLRQQEEGTTETKVPFFGDIPLLGWLFKNEVVTIRHSVLTIFITPRILKPGETVPQWPKVNREDHPMVPIMDPPTGDPPEEESGE